MTVGVAGGVGVVPPCKFSFSDVVVAGWEAGGGVSSPPLQFFAAGLGFA